MPLDPFRAAIAVDDDPGRAANKLADDLAGQGSGGTVGFIYVTDRLGANLSSLVETLRHKTGIESWIGTIGLGVIGGRSGAFDQPAVAAMICGWPKDQFALYDRVAPPFKISPDAFGIPTAIVHVDPRHPFDGELKALSAASGAYLLGGLSASRTRRFDQVAGKMTEGGISGLLLGPDVSVAIGVSQGCSPIGPIRTITETQDNLVTSLDGVPPLQALLVDLAVAKEDELRQLLLSLHVGLPVPNCDTGDYVVRNIAGINTENGYIAVADEVRPGQKLFFCRRDRAAATKDLRTMAAKLRGRMEKVHGALYVSCCARGPNLFDSAAEEVELVQEQLGGVPLVGFYANGEIAGDRVYGYTGVLALF
ncbi:MAG TPA: FIST C-terminal domain-containing protein [Beijerinckia sp.]|jgi:small ligand-binding sensory domain FIST|nr:FIST C-terminal domain-containing protein [Beijerinckia sp.]